MLLIAEEEAGGNRERKDEKKRKRGTDAVVVETKRLKKEKDERIAQQAAQTKKKMWKPRYQICVQCEMEYDVTKNGESMCRWHPGESPRLFFFFFYTYPLSFLSFLCTFFMSLGRGGSGRLRLLPHRLS